MDGREILFKKIPTIENSIDKAEDLGIITISNKPLRISSKDPSRISNEPTVYPLIITAHGPISYSSNKVVSWNYGAEVYYHGINKDAWIE